MVTRILFQARSITIFATAAIASFCFTNWRIFRSACRNSGNSFEDAYQRDRHSLLSASRNPIGLTFCPILILSLLLVWSRSRIQATVPVPQLSEERSQARTAFAGSLWRDHDPLSVSA